MTQIAKYDKLRAGMAAMKAAADFIPDASTKEGYEKSKRVSLDIGKGLTLLEKTRKDEKAVWLDGGKAVDSEAKIIKAEMADLQEAHKAAYQDVDNAKKEREKARKDTLQARLDEIIDMPEDMRDMSSVEVAEACSFIRSISPETFAELELAALKAKKHTGEVLARMFEQKEREESDAAELKVMREAQEKRDLEQREAEIKADAERAANERVEKAEREATDAVNNAERMAEENHERALRAEEAATAKRESDLAHTTAIMTAAKDALISLGLSTEDARGVVRAIKSGAIPNITINF